MYYQLLQNDDGSYAITIPLGTGRHGNGSYGDIRKILMPNVGTLRTNEVKIVLKTLNDLWLANIKETEESN